MAAAARYPPQPLACLLLLPGAGLVLPTLRMFCLELAIEISDTSLGSSQILRLPVLSTAAASRFCSRSDT